VVGGVEGIRKTIFEYSIECDYQVQDTLVVANNSFGFKDISKEHKARLALSYESILYNKPAVASVIGSSKYVGGNRYGDTFGINPFLYVQKFKQILIE